MILESQTEALPQDKVRLLQQWLSQPEAQLLREQLIALAVQKAVEASNALCQTVGDPGYLDDVDRTAKLAAEEAVMCDKFLALLRWMQTGKTGKGDFQYLRVKPIVNQNL